MAGHRRHDGYPICPPGPKPFKTRESASPSLGSPPPTPPRQYERSPSSSGKGPNQASNPPQQLPPAAFTASFEFPSAGPWHWRNPNWEEPNSAPPAPPPSAVKLTLRTREPTPGGASLAPTVLVDDDGNTIHSQDVKSEDDHHGTDASFSSSLLDRVALADPRVVRVVGTKRGDEHVMLRVQEAAAKRGVHAGLVHVPRTLCGGGGSVVKKQHSWWMVLGRDGDVVNQIVDAQQRPRGLMPGVVGDLKMEGPRMATFLQLILAGFIGGVVAVYALALL